MLGEFMVFYLFLFPIFFSVCYIPQLLLCALCRKYHSAEDMMPMMGW